MLAVATIHGWRPALLGTGAGLLLLAVVVLAPVLNRIPIQVLQLVIGVLLLLFGLRAGYARRFFARQASSRCMTRNSRSRIKHPRISVPTLHGNCYRESEPNSTPEAR